MGLGESLLERLGETMGEGLSKRMRQEAGCEVCEMFCKRLFEMLDSKELEFVAVLMESLFFKGVL